MRAHITAAVLLLAIPAGVRSFHYTWWSDNPQPYVEAIQKFGAATPAALKPGERVRAGIVTHHFLASSLIVRFFATLAVTTSAKTIVLIGPNHFHHGSANISFSSLPWKTPFGIVETDARVVQSFKDATGLAEDPEAFTGEHSVGVLIPFVKYYFRQSRVVPILIDVNARQRSLEQSCEVLTGLLRNPEVLVLLSMDFSHDSIIGVAEARDGQTEQVISRLDVGQTKDLNVDCRRGLWLLLRSLDALGGVRVQVREHTNSARLTGNLQQPDVTSYFTILFIR